MKQQESQAKRGYENTQASSTSEPGGEMQSRAYDSAFEYLKSLPPYQHRFCKEGYTEKKPSEVITPALAIEYTTRFRSMGDNEVTVPISWSFDKAALLNLLGITSYEDYSEVNGVRFYTGINEDGQLTIIAVSTTAGSDPECEDCSDDLTVDDEYPYYDYADPCPNNCSNTGNLKSTSSAFVTLQIAPPK
ncbi:MAG: hypothetical protein JWO03_1705 [Bacteroidetes bacterium]|nr:hypothetical protein [Bacteroidota bacterium]